MKYFNYDQKEEMFVEISKAEAESLNEEPENTVVVTDREGRRIDTELYYGKAYTY